jgi:hypothetical protein
MWKNNVFAALLILYLIFLISIIKEKMGQNEN